MVKHMPRSCSLLVVSALLILSAPLSGVSRADQINLSGNQQMTMPSYPGKSMRFFLTDQSQLFCVGGGGPEVGVFPYGNSILNMSGGIIDGINSSGNATVNMYGGNNYDMYITGNSTANISGGFIENLLGVYNTSTANISGGVIEFLTAQDTSIVNISGGFFEHDGSVSAYGGTVIFYGKDFQLGQSLSLSGEQVLGTGTLSGEWADGTPWSVNIAGNAGGADIVLSEIPEPATMGLLAVGLAALMARRRASK